MKMEINILVFLMLVAMLGYSILVHLINLYEPKEQVKEIFSNKMFVIGMNCSDDKLTGLPDCGIGEKSLVFCDHTGMWRVFCGEWIEHDNK